jgi:hypothetical protein
MRYQIPASYTPEDRKRVKAIMVQLLTSQAAKGEYDPDDPEQMKAAAKRAFHDALAAYQAALEFICG